jgi:hypothetical protein
MAWICCGSKPSWLADTESASLLDASDAGARGLEVESPPTMAADAGFQCRAGGAAECDRVVAGSVSERIDNGPCNSGFSALSPACAMRPGSSAPSKILDVTREADREAGEGR